MRLISLLQWEKVARFTATDEVLLRCIAETNLISLCSHPHPYQNSNPPCLGDADRVCFANRSIPALSAGVQTMRARICSAISCDMFARVV